jgi:hypothetical protein
MLWNLGWRDDPIPGYARNPFAVLNSPSVEGSPGYSRIPVWSLVFCVEGNIHRGLRARRGTPPEDVWFRI